MQESCKGNFSRDRGLNEIFILGFGLLNLQKLKEIRLLNGQKFT